MQESQTVFDQIKDFFEKHLQYFGLFMIFLGVGFLLAAIFDANWIYGDVSGSTYNMKKIDGWVNLFGRKTARVISGILSVLVILGGIFWFWMYAFYYN